LSLFLVSIWSNLILSLIGMQDNYTPLILASKNGHVDAVKLLCEVGKANVDIKAGWVSLSFRLY
jgi:hypothetical protein